MPIMLSVPVPVCRLVISTARDNRQPHGNFVRNHLRAGAQRAHQRVVRVRRPARHDDAQHAQRRNAQHEQDADVHVGDGMGAAEGDDEERGEGGHGDHDRRAPEDQLVGVRGMMSSLISSFRASAKGCSRPCGPTRIGPSRTCMCARTLRSSQFMRDDGQRNADGDEQDVDGRPEHAAGFAGYAALKIQIDGVKALAVDLAQHDVQRSDDRDHVGDQQAAHHLVERLQIDERGRPHADAVGLRRTVAHDEVSELALGRFDRVIDLARPAA